MALSLPATIEAVLFASGEPMTKKALSTMLEIPTEMVEAAIAELGQTLGSRGLALVQNGDQVELRTAPEAAPAIKRLRESELSRDLGKAGLEALAIVMYRGGATRSEIDWVRGVNSTAAIRSLMLRGLIERGEDSTDRRRAHYTPTVDALAHLGLRSKEELPHFAEFAAALAKEEAAAAVEISPEPTVS